MYKIGDTFESIPTAYGLGDNGAPGSKARNESKKVRFTVIQVNRKRRWFRASYQTQFFGTQHECFKF